MFHIYYCYTTERMIKGFFYYQDIKKVILLFFIIIIFICRHNINAISIHYKYKCIYKYIVYIMYI